MNSGASIGLRGGGAGSPPSPAPIPNPLLSRNGLRNRSMSPTLGGSGSIRSGSDLGSDGGMSDFDPKKEKAANSAFKGAVKGTMVGDRLRKEVQIQPPPVNFNEDYSVTDEIGLVQPLRKENDGHIGFMATQETHIYDIVDIDDHELWENYVSHRVVGRILDSAWFKALVFGAILLNSIMIGLQTNTYVFSRYQYAFNGIDYIFLTIFSIEIMMRWYYDFRGFWYSGWNVMDFVLVAVSLFGEGMSFISTGRVLRILRVLRAARGLSGLRSIKLFERLQLIVQTLLQSIPDILNICILLIMTMFVFAVIGVNVFQDICPQFFGDLYAAFFTLFVFVTMDGWLDIYACLEDNGMGLLGAVYVVSFTVIGAFVFANVISGVTVTNLQTAEEIITVEKEEARRELSTVSSTVRNQVDDVHFSSVSDVYDGMWQNQAHAEVPNLSTVTPNQLEKYALVLMCLEHNMEEYSQCRAELEEVFDVVRQINHDDDREGDDGNSMVDIDIAILKNSLEPNDADVIQQRMRMGV